MRLLTDREIEQLAEGIAIDDFNHDLARRVEAAVLRKLATVSVEWPESASSSHEVYLREQIEPMLAAARVQAIEGAAKICECQWSTLEERDAGIEFAEAIRELIGGKDGSAK